MKKLLVLLLLCSCSSQKESFAKTEFTKIAERLEVIASQLERKKIDIDGAITLIEMQSAAIRITLLTMEAIR